ncbi:MAG: hydrogenase maturation nickel metallochaperone HypA [Solirubrobacteraceae bacterium MAG38_C4-C5]|nr:hydrogenase maturation nickel metallochaperone HypA [Candidatus Siliceabacter maunaloa]
MHELAIADAIVQVASRHAAGRRVVAIDLRVGHLRQVVADSLLFGFELTAQGTSLEGAQLNIEAVPAAGACRACDAYGPLGDFPLSCARCGALDVEVLEGEELEVEALEVERSEVEMARSGGSP